MCCRGSMSMSITFSDVLRPFYALLCLSESGNVVFGNTVIFNQIPACLLHLQVFKCLLH